MIVPVDRQLLYFFATVIAGVMLGVLTDIYRVMLGGRKRNKLLLSISDLLFWGLCTLLVFELLFYTNNGNIRYYTIIGFILGLSLYFPLVSKRLIITLRVMMDLAIWMLRALRLIVMWPLARIRYAVRFVLIRRKSRHATKTKMGGGGDDDIAHADKHCGTK